jgi:hypothetical protein
VIRGKGPFAERPIDMTGRQTNGADRLAIGSEMREAS